MIADDADALELVLERFDVVEGGGFEIENDSIGTMLGDRIVQFRDRAGDVHPVKRIAQRRREHLCNGRIALQ